MESPNQWAVLFVDDDPSMLQSYKRALLGEPYQQFFASSGPEALDVLAHNQIHVVLTDLCMPKMSGLELVREIQEKFPHIVHVVISGQPTLEADDISSMVQSIHKGEILRFVSKTADMIGDVKRAVADALKDCQKVSV